MHEWTLGFRLRPSKAPCALEPSSLCSLCASSRLGAPKVRGADNMWQGFMSQACQWLHITSDHLSVLSAHSMEAPNCKGDGEMWSDCVPRWGKNVGFAEHKVTSATGENGRRVPEPSYIARFLFSCIFFFILKRQRYKSARIADN